MKQITAITDDALQQLSWTLDNGNIVQVNLNYVPSQQGWFYSLNYTPANFTVTNQLIVNSPNLLRKYRNVIPFGLCVTVIDGYEIINQSDFVSGRVSVYLLNPNDVQETEILITVTLPTSAGAFIS